MYDWSDLDFEKIGSEDDMKLLLVILLLALGIILFFLQNKDLCSASLIMCGVFFLSAFIALLNASKWGFTLRPFTVMVIITGIMVFALGEWLVNRCYVNREKPAALKKDLPEAPVWCVFVISFLMLLMLWYYYGQVRRMVYEYSGGYENLIYNARQAIVNGKDLNKAANHMSCFCQCLAYWFLFLFLRGLSEKKKLGNMWNLLPVLLFLPFKYLIGERTGYIYLIVFAFIVWTNFYQIGNGRNIGNAFKIVAVAIGGLLIYFVLFRVTGLAKNSGVGVSAFSSISKYCAFSIPGLDFYLTHPFGANAYFGEHTLYRIYSITNRLGLTQITISPRYLPDLNLNGVIVSNIYTGFARYIQDYGYVGMYVILLLMGGLYGLLRNKVLYGKRTEWWLLLYGTVLYPVAMMSIDELFFTEILSTNVVYILVYYVVIGLVMRIVAGRRRETHKT